MDNKFKIKDIGFGLGMAGMVMTSKDDLFIIPYPDEQDMVDLPKTIITPDDDEYAAIIRQMDMHEVEIFDKDLNKKVTV